MSEPTVDPTRCPLCGGANGCAMARLSKDAADANPPACWCIEVRFDPVLLARIPPEARRRACVCQGCAEAQRPASVMPRACKPEGG